MGMAVTVSASARNLKKQTQNALLAKQRRFRSLRRYHSKLAIRKFKVALRISARRFNVALRISGRRGVG
jgi:hypothetical protein